MFIQSHVWFLVVSNGIGIKWILCVGALSGSDSKGMFEGGLSRTACRLQLKCGGVLVYSRI